MKTIKVNTNQAYEVYIDNNALGSLSYFLELNKIEKNRKILVITDTNVEGMYLKQLVENISSNNYKCDSFVINAGEKNKNLSTVENILRYLAKNNYRRKDILISLGGGVVGDIVGLCASLYMRGIDFIQIPTTLLAIVDASVGGKTAVDLPEGKNLIGSFYQPKFVVCDLEIIRNLPADIYNEGLAEIIKYGIIADSTILELLENDKNNLEEIVYRCVNIKSNIVSKDEKDNDVRKILNFGHTFAHALEKISNYSITHGNAVANGLIFELILSNKIEICPTEYCKKIYQIVRQYYTFEKNIDINLLIEGMQKDKKNISNEISFIIFDANQNYIQKDIKKEVIADAWHSYINLLNNDRI